MVCSSLMGCSTRTAPAASGAADRRIHWKCTNSLVRVKGMVSRYPRPAMISLISPLRTSEEWARPTVTVWGSRASRLS